MVLVWKHPLHNGNLNGLHESIFNCTTSSSMHATRKVGIWSFKCLCIILTFCWLRSLDLKSGRQISVLNIPQGFLSSTEDSGHCCNTISFKQIHKFPSKYTSNVIMTTAKGMHLKLNTTHEISTIYWYFCWAVAAHFQQNLYNKRSKDPEI